MPTISSFSVPQSTFVRTSSSPDAPRIVSPNPNSSNMSQHHRNNKHAEGTVEKRVLNRIFVGGLNDTINEDDLRELFGQFGELKEVNLKDRGAKLKDGGTHRGHGFVTFHRIQDAAKALENGRGEVLEIRGIRLNVCQAVRRTQNVHSARPDSHPAASPSVAPNGDYAALIASQQQLALLYQMQGLLPYYGAPYNYGLMNGAYGLNGSISPHYSGMAQMNPLMFHQPTGSVLPIGADSRGSSPTADSDEGCDNIHCECPSRYTTSLGIADHSQYMKLPPQTPKAVSYQRGLEEAKNISRRPTSSQAMRREASDFFSGQRTTRFPEHLSLADPIHRDGHFVEDGIRSGGRYSRSPASSTRH